MKGYYTNAEGAVIGYWELNHKPVDTEEYKWFIVDDGNLPPIPKKPDVDDIRKVRADALNAILEEKIAATPSLKARADKLAEVKA